MLKWFNKKRKDNKGFTLVELVIVVAILAILVGILAPQYTKYVERSRKAADVANLEEFVKAVQVMSVDDAYDVKSGDIAISLKKDGAHFVAGDNDAEFIKALHEFCGGDWVMGDVANPSVKLKSSRWENNEGSSDYIMAICTIEDSGSVTVEYNPTSIQEQLKDTAEDGE